MIRLTKGPCPPALAATVAEKTLAFVTAPANDKPTPWNTQEIRDAVRRESNGKCMYCEGRPDDVAYGAVEHIKPKKHFPNLVLEWLNLGLACTRCNTNKKDYWSDNVNLRLLNPYSDDPTTRILFAGPLAVATPGDQNAKNTIRQLKLNREQLFFARSERIEQIDFLIAIWSAAEDDETRSLAAQDVVEALRDNQEFASALREFVRWRGFEIPDDLSHLVDDDDDQTAAT